MEKMDQFVENVTLHGIVRIWTAKNMVVKVFWLILFSGSSGYLMYNVVQISKNFANYSVITKDEKKVEQPLQFPAVTFCPANAHKENFTREISMNDTKVKDILRQAEKNQSFVQSYKFGYKNYDFPDYFKMTVVPEIGMCYTFNPDGKLFQKKAGSLYGLNIILLDSTLGTIYKNLSNGRGILMSAYPHEEFHFPWLDGMGLSPGFATIIGLRKRTIIRKESPYTSNCTTGGERDLVFPGKYTLNNCELSCTEIEAIKRCGSTVSAMTPIFMSKEKKSLLLRSRNISSATRCLSKEGMTKSLLDTECNCQLPCHEVTFERTISSEKLSKDHMLRVYVYFEEMSDEIITELPQWTSSELLGNIGGVMGILLGASVFSVIELFILIGYVPFNLLFKRKTFSVHSDTDTSTRKKFDSQV